MKGDLLMEGNALVTAVEGALTTIIKMVGEVVTAVTTGGLKDLLPMFAIGIGISVLLFGIRAIKSVVWGA